MPVTSSFGVKIKVQPEKWGNLTRHRAVKLPLPPILHPPTHLWRFFPYHPPSKAFLTPLLKEELSLCLLMTH